jgi:hypothetical protein
MSINQIKESGIRLSLKDSQYKPKLDELNSKVEPILARTSNVLTNYTEHTLRHSLGIESVYDVLLDGDYTILTDKEKYLLIAATLLHDIGMVGNKEELSKMGYEAYRRNGHHNFSRDIIIREAPILGFNRTEASLIADIAAAHRKIPLDSLEESVASEIGDHIRLRLLGALLRFADELHITNDRSSELVVNIVQPDANSLQHHDRHLSIIGVSRNPKDRHKIMVSAIVNDWEAEKSMDELIQEITKKHAQVNQILNENSIVITDISKQYRNVGLVTKEVLLALSKSNFSTFELMEVLNHREGSTVARVVGSLADTSVIEPVSETPEQYQIKSDSFTFKAVFNNLKDTEKLIEFMQTSYVENNIVSIFDKIALEIYSNRVTGGDKEDRLQLIKNSPTVLNNLLNEQEMNDKFGQLDRSVILDLLILNGYMQDVAKNPILSKEEEIVLAMQNIQNNIHKNLGGFLRLVQHLNPESQQITREIMTEQIEKKKLENNNQQQNTITITSTVNKEDLPHTNFYSLYLASASSGEPFRIYKNINIKDFSIEGKEEKVGDLVSLEFRPNLPTVPFIEGDFWTEIQEDLPNRALHLKLKIKETAKTDFPYITRLSIFSQKLTNFDIECAPFASAKDHLKLQQVLHKIRELDYRRIYFESNDSENLITASCPTLIANVNRDRRKLIELIAELELKLTTQLTVPLNCDEKTLNSVIALREKINSEANLSEDQINDYIKEYENIIFNPKTTFINVELANQNGFVRNLLIHQSGWIKYSKFGFKPIDAKKAYEWHQVVKRQGAIKITTNVRQYTPLEFLNSLVENSKSNEFFKSLFDLLEINTNLDMLFKSSVEIDFNEPSGNLQVITVKITQVDGDWNIMESLYESNDFLNLVPIFEKFGNNDTALAYGYVLKGQYNEAIKLANSIIKQQIMSVAHMTKGLAYVGLGDNKKAFEAYLLGVNACGYEWYPQARDNLLEFIQKHKIPASDELANLEKLLSIKRKPLSPNKRCYCGSKKSFKKCHANVTNFN